MPLRGTAEHPASSPLLNLTYLLHGSGNDLSTDNDLALIRHGPRHFQPDLLKQRRRRERLPIMTMTPEVHLLSIANADRALDVRLLFPRLFLRSDGDHRPR